jgi:predicted membrane channel-forming protein YqfA (hemolysin III family)
MKTNINWKKFIISSIVIFIVFIFVADILMDKIFKPKEFDWNKILGFENLFWKILAALVGAYFYSSDNQKEKK